MALNILKSRDADTRTFAQPLEQVSPAGISVQVLTDVNALLELAPAWERLWLQTPNVSAFQRFEWILACIRHEPHSDRSPFVMVLRHGGDPLAIFPTQLGHRGKLSFIGARIANYCGPLYEPAALSSVVKAWRDAVSAERRIRSIDFMGLRERSPFLGLLSKTTFPRWGMPKVLEMNSCPEVDLHEGWDKIFRRHKYHHRANWRRKWERLAELGQLEFVETSDPKELEAAFPKVFDLYDARWRGKHVRGALAPEHYRLQLEAGMALGSQGLARLSLLRLDGEIIAFSYGLRGLAESTSYFVAHDAALETFSPGQLLLNRILEAAALRGELSYDFSLGHASYKAMWATGEQRVFSVLLGRGAGLAAARRRCWRAARSSPLLRRLKQEGIRGLSTRKKKTYLTDQPGLSAGPTDVWHVYRIQDGPPTLPPLVVRLLGCSEMRGLFSPRLLALALDRHYRGDRALAMERDGKVIGAIWKAAPHRRSIVTGECELTAEPGPVYYHPVVSEGEDMQQIVLSVAGGESVVVTSQSVTDERAKESHAFQKNL